MLSYRRERGGEFIRQELTLLLRQAVRDPRLQALTVTDVNLTPDRRIARVYVACYNGDEDALQQGMAALASAGSFLRRGLSRNLRWRFTPELEFHVDRSWQHGERIDALLRDLDLDEESAADDDTAD